MKGRRPPPDWGEGVLDSIGLGLSSVPHEHDAPEANASQIKEETLNLPPDDLHDFQLPEGALDAATDASLPAPPTPLPSPMLEVPPTPAEDFRSSWASPASPMASPMASPAVPSPLWQPLDASASPDALHPLPSPVLRSPRGLRIIRRPEASPKRLPQGGPQSASEPSRQPSHPPSDPLGPQSGGDQAPKANETNEKPDCVLRTLFSMSDFHEILLEGLGFTPLRPFSRSLPTAPRGEEEAEPPAKRARRIWAILRPPSEPSPLEGLTASWASAPPKVSRYGQATLPEVAGMAVPGAAPMSSEKRKRLQHSEVARYLWGKDVRVKGEKRYLQMRCVVRAPISSKKRWSGKSPPSASELSLRAEQPFVLYEYIEESPVLLMNMGMGHEVFSYFVPRKKRYEGELLGPLRCHPTRLNGPVPLLASQIHLKAGHSVSVMESNLLQAPLHCHEVTDSRRFLLIWNGEDEKRTDREKNGPKGQTAQVSQLYLRPLSRICVVGQVEPIRLVQAPTSRECAQMRSSCIRHMLHHAQGRWLKDFKGDLGDDEVDEGEQTTRALRQNILPCISKWFPDQASLVRAEFKESRGLDARYDLPESVCLLESMRRGEERLRMLGIDHLYHFDSQLMKALQDLEELERRRKGEQDVLRARWALEQLQLAPWNLASRYASFRKKKGSLLAIAGPGDPSNGRLEGISFLPLLVKQLGDCLALAKLCLEKDGGLCLRLKQLGFSDERIEALGRWDRIALLCTKLGREEKDSQVSCVTGWSRVTLPNPKQATAELRQRHDRLLQDAFHRQLLVLAGPATTPTPAVPALAGGEGQKDVDIPDAEAAEAALIEALEDSPKEPVKSPEAREESDDDKMEMQRFRDQIGIKPKTSVSTAATSSTASAAASAATQMQSKPVKMLKVVSMSWGALGHEPQERVLYVFGEENIRLYKQLRGEPGEKSEKSERLGRSEHESQVVRQAKPGTSGRSNLSRASDCSATKRDDERESQLARGLKATMPGQAKPRLLKRTKSVITEMSDSNKVSKLSS